MEEPWRTLTLRSCCQQRDGADVYLACFAISVGCRTVSCHKGFTQYGGLEFLQLKVLRFAPQSWVGCRRLVALRLSRVSMVGRHAFTGMECIATDVRVLHIQ